MMSDEQNLPIQPADSLGEAGLSALQKEREARKQLERELTDLKGKANSGDVLASELQLTRTQLQAEIAAKQKIESDMRSQIEERDKRIADIVVENQFNRAASKINLAAEYSPLIFNAHRHEFKLDEQGNVVAADGRSLDQWLEGTREKLPALFSAPSLGGSGAKESRHGSGKAKVISREDARGFLSNLDGIISGEIQTE